MSLKLSGHLCQHPQHCPSTRNNADSPILSKWEVGGQAREKQGLTFTLTCHENALMGCYHPAADTNMITSHLW